jgi:PAS domain S-box-containing protein
MMIMGEAKATQPSEDKPTGAAIGALPRARHDLRDRVERRIEASAMAVGRRTTADRLTFTLIVVAVFAAFTWVVRALTDTGPGPLSPILIAIGLATWYGGVRQGLLATVLGLAASYFLMDPTESFERPDGTESVHLGGLLLVAPAAALVSDGLRSSVVHSNDLAETRRRLLMAVAASEERWRAFNESVPALISEWTNEGKLVYCNAQWMEYTGLSFEQLRDDPLGCAHPEDRGRVGAAWQHATMTETPIEIEWRIQRHDGAYRWHYGIVIPSFLGEGRPPIWVGVNVDIDARKRAQAEAQFQREMRDQSETRARLAMLAAHLESWVCDIEDGQVTALHRELHPGRGRRASERWDEWLAHVHPQDRDHVSRAVHACIEQRHELDTDFRVVERNRAVKWMHVWGRVLYGDDGDPRRLIAVQQDVTDLKHAEQSAREGEEHLRRLADANIIGVASGVGSVITEANDNFLRMLNYTHEDVSQRRLRWEMLTPPGDARVDGEVYAELLRRGASEPRRRDYVRKDGELRHVIVGTLLLERRPFRWVRFTIDLTDQVNADEAMQRALRSAEEANATKDEFVALVAHELRGPITTIAGNAEVLEKRAAMIDETNREAALADIRSEADRLRRMIQDLLVLARIERNVAIEPEPLRLERVVSEVAQRHQRSYPERDLRITVAEDVPLVNASGVYTDQVISNLLTNAEKYSPKEQPVEVVVDAEAASGRVRILDHGAGIAAEEMEQVFRPFYRSRSTAGRAEGFGIGLTVCRRLIEAQGGRIWASPRQGGGSEFGFTLPAASDDTNGA